MALAVSRNRSVVHSAVSRCHDVIVSLCSGDLKNISILGHVSSPATPSKSSCVYKVLTLRREFTVQRSVIRWML